MKPKTEISLKFWLSFAGFVLIVLFVPFSDYLVSKLAYILANKQNLIITIMILIGCLIGMVEIYKDFKKQK